MENQTTGISKKTFWIIIAIFAIVLLGSFSYIYYLKREKAVEKAEKKVEQVTAERDTITAERDEGVKSITVIADETEKETDQIIKNSKHEIRTIPDTARTAKYDYITNYKYTRKLPANRAKRR